MVRYTVLNPLKFTKVITLVLFCMYGCEDYVEIPDPTEQISNREVFSDDVTATAAVTTLYANLRDEVFLTGKPYGMSVLMGYYSDELDYYAAPTLPIESFYTHNVLPANDIVKQLWDGGYRIIYRCNLALEGIAGSPDLSPAIREQLFGEALFIRALAHFYLANLYGDIPYITTTDYVVNQDVARLPLDRVYENILNDLLEAKTILPKEYISGERIRANRFVVSAFLSRVYLYMENWQLAIDESSTVIDQTGLFHMETLENEFLKESSSAIFQLKPQNVGENTHEASTFLFVMGPPISMGLRPSLMASFEDDDLRPQQWIRNITNGTQTWYASSKYDQVENTGESMEYSIVFRLAEQFLIRAEAKMRTGDITGAEQDLNVVRNRAGLANIERSTPAALENAILLERMHELFTEHGQRWFDLKRLDRAQEFLLALKPNWQATDVLLPLPELELMANPNLLPQNPGY